MKLLFGFLDLSAENFVARFIWLVKRKLLGGLYISIG
jgi:hypothetical protein